MCKRYNHQSVLPLSGQASSVMHVNVDKNQRFSLSLDCILRARNSDKHHTLDKTSGRAIANKDEPKSERIGRTLVANLNIELTSLHETGYRGKLEIILRQIGSYGLDLKEMGGAAGADTPARKITCEPTLQLKYQGIRPSKRKEGQCTEYLVKFNPPGQTDGSISKDMLVSTAMQGFDDLPPVSPKSSIVSIKPETNLSDSSNNESSSASCLSVGTAADARNNSVCSINSVSSVGSVGSGDGSGDDQQLSKYPIVGSQRKLCIPKDCKGKRGKYFQCTGYGDCNMRFASSEHLARHIRKHTGERPFVCRCNRAFSRLDNLRQHIFTVHSNNVEKYQIALHRGVNLMRKPVTLSPPRLMEGENFAVYRLQKRRKSKDAVMIGDKEEDDGVAQYEEIEVKPTSSTRRNDSLKGKSATAHHHGGIDLERVTPTRVQPNVNPPMHYQSDQLPAHFSLPPSHVPPAPSQAPPQPQPQPQAHPQPVAHSHSHSHSHSQPVAHQQGSQAPHYSSSHIHHTMASPGDYYYSHVPVNSGINLNASSYYTSPPTPPLPAQSTKLYTLPNTQPVYYYRDPRQFVYVSTAPPVTGQVNTTAHYVLPHSQYQTGVLYPQVVPHIVGQADSMFPGVQIPQ